MSTQADLGVKARRILERFPSFMAPLSPHKRLAHVVSAAAAPLDALDLAMHMVLESHWVERAGGDDLERIGALFGLARLEAETPDQYRFRLTRLVRNQLQYGCTPRGVLEAAAAAIGVELVRDSLGRAVITTRGDLPRRHATILGGPADGMILDLEETPFQVRQTAVQGAASGARLAVRNHGFRPAVVTVSITAGPDGVEGPGIVSLTGNCGMRFAGGLAPGQRLSFRERSVTLRGDDGAELDVSGQGERFRGGLWDGAVLSAGAGSGFVSTFYEPDPDVTLTVPVGESVWAYAAASGTAQVEFTWTERTRASFVVRIPAVLGHAALSRAAAAVDRVRAAGVKGLVESYV